MAASLEVNPGRFVNTAQLLLDLRSVVGPDVGVIQYEDLRIRVKKNTPWTPEQAQIATDLVNAAKPKTAVTDAKNDVDRYPLSLKAFVLVVLDEVNTLRNQLGLPPRTAQQLMTAIKNKVAEIG